MGISDRLNTIIAACISILRLYSGFETFGGGMAKSGYSGPPIQIKVSLSAISGLVNKAEAISVSPAPQSMY